jgi:hypothetical protein
VAAAIDHQLPALVATAELDLAAAHTWERYLGQARARGQRFRHVL